MDAKKLSQIADFVRDERRLNAAFANVLEGIDSGAISINGLPIAAKPIKRVTLGQRDPEYAASMVEKISGVDLNEGQRADLLKLVQAMPTGGTMSMLNAAVTKCESLSALSQGLKEVQTTGIYDSLFTNAPN